VSIHPPITGAKAADRLAIRELFDAYAHCADRRDAQGKMALFTEDTHFVVYMDARNPEPAQDLHGRQALAPVFDAVNAYVATMHFNGQSTVELDGDQAAGESYCLAHHLSRSASPEPPGPRRWRQEHHPRPPGRVSAMYPGWPPGR
jgi:ketosteroid isomerase-like protein